MAEESTQPDTPQPAAEKTASQKPPSNPVRRWTFIILALCALLLAWYYPSMGHHGAEPEATKAPDA